MSSVSSLEPEDLENVPLVRMADVQPDRSVEVFADNRGNCAESLDSQCSDEWVIGSCTVDESELDCVVDDNDSNIGSMVSIQSEEVVEEDMEDDDIQFIITEILDPHAPDIKTEKSKILSRPTTPGSMKPPAPDNWPVLEILPGGVINQPEQIEKNEHIENPDSMMYACAKCSQRFTDLYSLVKHVRCHEGKTKKAKVPETDKSTTVIDQTTGQFKQRKRKGKKTMSSNSKNIKGIKQETPRYKTEVQQKYLYLCKLVKGKKRVQIQHQESTKEVILLDQISLKREK